MENCSSTTNVPKVEDSTKSSDEDWSFMESLYTKLGFSSEEDIQVLMEKSKLDGNLDVELALYKLALCVERETENLENLAALKTLREETAILLRKFLDVTESQNVSTKAVPRSRFEKVLERLSACSETQLESTKQEDVAPKPREGKNRKPQKAVVVVVFNKISAADALEKIEQQMSDLGQGRHAPTIRYGASGNMIIEITGPDKDGKADVLARKLRDVLKEDVRVTTPTRQMTFRISCLGMFTTKECVAKAVVEATGCSPSELSVSEVLVDRREGGIVWVTCPQAVGLSLLDKSSIKVGCSYLKIKRVDKQLRYCYRCLQVGHIGANCKLLPGKERCRNCGGENHYARDCKSKPKCIRCQEKDLSSNHNFLSFKCPLRNVKKSKSKRRKKKKGSEKN